MIEICPAAGWVKDLCDALGQKLIVANTSDEPWRWRKTKVKTDRKDALKLAKLQAMNQISAVHIPSPAVRQWRSLIQYRQSLIADGTSMRNRIRGILDQVARRLPAGGKAFSQAGRQQWEKDLGRKLEECAQDELWRGMILTELSRLRELEGHIAAVDKKLGEIAAADERVQRVKAGAGGGRTDGGTGGGDARSARSLRARQAGGQLCRVHAQEVSVRGDGS